MKQISLQKQILDRIKSQRVHPTPKGFFRVRDYALWLFLAIFVAALSLGSSMVIFLVRGVDRSLFAKLGLSIPQKLFYSIPLFWIAATIIIAGAAFLNIRRMRKGYRVSTRQFALMAGIAAAAFGSIIYAFNISRYIDNAAVQNIPLYSAMVPFNTNAWFDPEHGLLSGSIKIKSSDNSFTLRDQNFELWTVTGEGVSIVPAGFKFQSGDRVKIIGKRTGDLQFRAVEIRPFDMGIQKDL